MKRIIGFVSAFIIGLFVLASECKRHSCANSKESITCVKVTNNSGENYITFWSPMDSTKHSVDERIRDYFIGIHGDFSLTQLFYESAIVGEHKRVTPCFIKQLLPGQSFYYQIKAPSDKLEYCKSRIVFVPRAHVNVIIRNLEIPNTFLYERDTVLVNYEFVKYFY